MHNIHIYLYIYTYIHIVLFIHIKHIIHIVHIVHIYIYIHIYICIYTHTYIYIPWGSRWWNRDNVGQNLPRSYFCLRTVFVYETPCGKKWPCGASLEPVIFMFTGQIQSTDWTLFQAISWAIHQLLNQNIIDAWLCYVSNFWSPY